MIQSAFNFDVKKIETVLGKETCFKGDMEYEHSLKIDGEFEGTIESPGLLFIEEGAIAQANIKVNVLIIGGYLKGDIKAVQQVELLPKAKVYGNIKTARLRISDGAIFEGQCEMIKGAENIDLFDAPVVQLKQTLQNIS